MNLVGKIFTVLILVMSILFMGFAMMVYATHRNWRDEANATQHGVGSDSQRESASAGRNRAA